MKEIYPVIFRKFKDGDIIALFPSLVGNLNYSNCQSYMHIGQHASTNIFDIVSCTKLATEEEYKPLLNELVNDIGYDNLKVYKKVLQWMNKERKEDLERSRGK